MTKQHTHPLHISCSVRQRPYSDVATIMFPAKSIMRVGVPALQTGDTFLHSNCGVKNF